VEWQNEANRSITSVYTSIIAANYFAKQNESITAGGVNQRHTVVHLIGLRENLSVHVSTMFSDDSVDPII
jgi:hypothetical protein